MTLATPRLFLAGLFGLTLAAAPLSAQAGRNTEAYDLGAGRLAIEGYDPVAYFDEGGARPAEGQADIRVDHEGVVYRFANEANKQTFLADPERFEPAYGGWCAYAMSFDKRVSVDPLAFRVGQGRLLLFADTDYVEHDGGWVPEEDRLLGKADAKWKAFSGESARKAAPGSFRKYDQFNLTDDSLALEGHDPVAYFPEGGSKPRKGSTEYTLRHQGVKYRFASAANRDAFAADPARYEPQHGGWCSYAMGVNGEKVEVDPEAYRLTDGQLHLFYTSWLSDTRDDWDDDTAALKRKADANWDKLMAKAAPRG